MDIYSISIKQQEPHDLPAICRLIEEAFATVQESDHREQFLVKRLLSSPGFIPELSLTAWIDANSSGTFCSQRLKSSQRPVPFRL